jgi:hypothetical protein
VVRPERVRLASSIEETGGANSVAATVTDVARLGGGATRVDLRFADGSTGAATLPAMTSVTARPGDHIRAMWDVDAQAFVTPDADSAATAGSPSEASVPEEVAVTAGVR